MAEDETKYWRNPNLPAMLGIYLFISVGVYACVGVCVCVSVCIHTNTHISLHKYEYVYMKVDVRSCV